VDYKPQEVYPRRDGTAESPLARRSVASRNGCLAPLPPTDPLLCGPDCHPAARMGARRQFQSPLRAPAFLSAEGADSYLPRV
jgi:hypothetical protein